MTDIIPKNCQHCFFYDCDEHSCLFHLTFVGNVCSCKDWKPNIYIIKRYDIPEFVDYNDYFLTEEMIVFCKSNVSSSIKVLTNDNI